jgi:DNA-binding NarL/FixJ family response regulator
MIRVVVVDDQELVRDGFTLILDAQPDIEVVGQAGDGTQVVEVARATMPDVVLMDVRMPVRDGIEATHALRAAGFRRLAILMLTTFDLDEYVYSALRAGASGFLLKDVPRATLIEAVRTVAAGEALLAPTITRRLIERYVSGPQAPATPPDLDHLSDREQEVLLGLARGRSNAEIAQSLHISDATVKTHVGGVLRKLSVRDRIEAVIWAYETGFVRPGDE